MATPDSSTPVMNPSDTPSALDVPLPAVWSARARRFLRAASLLGFALAAIGLLMFLTTGTLLSEAAILNALLGLALIPIGLGTAYVAVRSQSHSPDQAYEPLGISNPRRWFFLIWIAGLIVYYFVVVPAHFSGFSVIFALIVAVAASAVLAGGLWCLRWLGEKYLAEWPTGRIEAPAPIPLRWPRNWTIAWSMLGGLFSAVLAGFLEILALQVFSPVFEDSVLRTVLSTSSDNVFSDFSFVLTIMLIFAIIAPLIEEACKALILRVFRKSITRPIDGVMFGMAAGLGFGLAESLFYLFSMFLVGAWWIGAWGRLATILMHGVTTSVIGLAYARSLRTGHRRDLIGGYIRAVILHGVWNGLFFATVIIALNGQGLLGCGGLIVWLIFMSRQLPRIATAGVEASVQEDYAAADQPLPPDWSPMDDGLAWKVVGSQPKYVERRSDVVSAVP